MARKKRHPDKPGIYPIPKGNQYYMTAKQLVEANRESIRLGMNHNLEYRNGGEEAILESGFVFPIEKACRHVGHKGRQNIRLLLFVAIQPDGTDGVFVTLDITLDAWADVIANGTGAERLERLRKAGHTPY